MSAYEHRYAIHAKRAAWRGDGLRPKMLARLANSEFGWLLWNPVLKWHNRTWGQSPVPGAEVPYLNGRQTPHCIQAIVSVCGFGFLFGFHATVGEDGENRLLIKNGGGVARIWLFGRVELRKAGEAAPA